MTFKTFQSTFALIMALFDRFFRVFWLDVPVLISTTLWKSYFFKPVSNRVALRYNCELILTREKNLHPSLAKWPSVGRAPVRTLSHPPCISLQRWFPSTHLRRATSWRLRVSHCLLHLATSLLPVTPILHLHHHPSKSCRPHPHHKATCSLHHHHSRYCSTGCMINGFTEANHREYMVCVYYVSECVLYFIRSDSLMSTQHQQ